MTVENTASAGGDASTTATAGASAAAPATATNADQGAASQGNAAGAASAAATAEADGAAGNAADATSEQKSGDEGAKADTVQVPESYEFKLPDGMDLDAVGAEEFTAIAKELKLSQADAQKIADVATRMQQRQMEAHVTTVKGWADASKADKEFGGDALEQNLGVARKAIDTFGTPELKKLLNDTGMGNHPEVIRAFFKAGKAISESTFAKSGARAPVGDSDPAKRLYPDHN